MKGFFGALTDAVYPRRCAFCGEDLSGGGGRFLCESCRYGVLEPDSSLRCPRCGIGVGEAALVVGSCTHCRGRSFKFERAFDVGSYKGKLREMLMDFKFRRRLYLANELGALLGEKVRREGVTGEVDFITYVPQTFVGRIVRGFNPAELLARKLSRNVDIAVARGLLERSGNARGQRGLCAKERVRNVRGAFRVRRDGFSKGKTFILVDDVLTTGATANECSKVLKRAGARKVFVAVIARPDLTGDD